MSSTFGSFEIARSGLSVAMQQLSVTEQNISNANTEGYTRQRLLTKAKSSSSDGYLISQLNKANVGQGVAATGIQQIRSYYLDQQFRTLNTNYMYSTTRDGALTYLTGLVNELDENSGLTTAIGNFYSALSSFSADTSSKEYRTNVQQQALAMTSSFNNVYEEMQSLWKEQNDSMTTVASEINSVAQKIADLNNAIARTVQTGGSSNELNDQRNLLLDELAGYANISYSLNAGNDSMLDVRIGGLLLVDGVTTNPITADSPASHVADIDSLTAQIAAVNSQVEAGSVTPSDGQTAIAALVTQLGQYMTVSSSLNADNPDLTDVTFNGAALVSGTTATGAADAVANNLTAWVEFNRSNLALDGSDLSIQSGTLTGGQLYANMEMVESQDARTPGIPYYMAQVNSFVRDMAEHINTIHQGGWTYPDGTTASRSGVSFFNVPSSVDGLGNTVYDYSKVNAGNFTLSSDVLSSVYNIAGSSQQISLSGSSSNSGNNVKALALINDLSDSGYYDKLNSIVLNLAVVANTGESVTSTRKSVLDSVDTQRQSMSSVSTDEETTNLIIFQQTYAACAKAISVLDNMLDTLINAMGR
ncbi:flagellar hook-associated protein FlgK [Oscillospiraceae bacterium WX1]